MIVSPSLNFGYYSLTSLFGFWWFNFSVQMFFMGCSNILKLWPSMCVYYYLLGSTSVQGNSNFRLVILFEEYFGADKVIWIRLFLDMLYWWWLYINLLFVAGLAERVMVCRGWKFCPDIGLVHHKLKVKTKNYNLFVSTLFNAVICVPNNN